MKTPNKNRITYLVLGFIWALSCSSSLITTQQRFPTQTALRPIASGFSTWLSQGMWLGRDQSLSKSNRATVEKQILETISLDPQSRFFRVNGAAILAYDLTAELEATELICKNELITKGIQLLEDGFVSDPKGTPLYHYEIGKIQLLKLNNNTLAREQFRFATEQPIQ